MQVLHRCEVRACINPAHLFLGTNADNVADKIAKGRAVNVRGAENGYAKLTDEKALAIFHAIGKQSDIGAQFGVNHRTVSSIKTKKGWRHIHGRMSPSAVA